MDDTHGTVQDVTQVGAWSSEKESRRVYQQSISLAQRNTEDGILCY